MVVLNTELFGQFFQLIANWKVYLQLVFLG